MVVKVPGTHSHKKCEKIAKAMNKPLFVNRYEIDCRICGGDNSMILQPLKNHYYCKVCKKNGNLDDLLEITERAAYGEQYNKYSFMSEMKGVNQ